jgi:hypothetical protein
MILAAALAATLAAASPGHAREIHPDGPGPQRLDADAALVAASARGDLSDLRLADAAGREVPYLAVPPSAPEGEWVAARVLAVPATRKESGLEADLGRLQTVSRLRLSGLPEPFLKRFRLEGSGDRVRWTVLVAEGTLFALPEEDLRLLEASFEPGAYRYLRVVWDDRSSARAPLARAEAFAPAPRQPPPAAPLVPLEVARREGEPGVSRYGLRLPGPHLPVRAIVIDAGGGHVRRRASVTESRLADGRLEPVALGHAELARVVRDGVTAGTLRIPVSRPEELELELRVEDGDNGPLDLRGVSAELEPLPWIYFESADGRPLTATAGDPERQAPRYDLEAVRPGLDRIATHRATLGPDTPAGPVEAPSPQAAPPDLAAGAPLDRAAFRWARDIPAAPPGLAAVRLDAGVLARSAGLADLRIAAPDGRQVPYLLEERPEPLAVPLPAPAPTSEPRAGGRGVAAYSVVLPERTLPPSRLVLETTSRVFERTVRVWADERRDGHGPRVVASATWRHADPERPPPPLTLALPTLSTARVVIAIDDGDNSPLPLASARLLLPAWRIRFFHPGPPLTLLAGADRIAPPRYDLALLAPRLRAAPAREVPLGPAPSAADEDEPGSRLRNVFWVAVAVAVAVLLLVLARLLGRGGGQGETGGPAPSA